MSSRRVAVGWLVAVAVLTVPQAGYPLPAGGEYEYQAGLTVAFRDHLQWGSQVVWTYGPLGYMNVLAYMDYRTWVAALAVNLLAHAIFFIVLALFLWRTRTRPFHWVLVGAIVLVFFERYLGFDFERFPVLDHKAALATVLLLYLSTEERNPRATAAYGGAAGLLLGFLLLVKGTYLLTAGLLVGAFALVLVIRHGSVRSFAAMFAGLVVSFLSLWLLASQSLGGIADYLRTSSEILAGYTPALSWFNESPTANPSLQLGFGVAMLGATAACVLYSLLRRDWSLLGLLILIVPLMFVVFKNSFVRFDEIHALTFWSMAAVLLGLVLVRALSSSDSLTRRVPSAIAYTAIVGSAVLVSGVGPLIGQTPGVNPVFALGSNLATYQDAVVLVVHPDRRAEEEAKVQNRLLAVYPLPPKIVSALRQGDVDVIPVDTQLVFAYGFKWNPQPVIQSYGVTTPYLDHLDAKHYSGPGAPRFVIFALKDLDGRYPLFSEPETYRALLERYQVLDALPDMVILQRRPNPPTEAPQPVGSTTARLGDWINVPPHADKRLYGRVEIQYSFLGHALNLIDRPPELHVRFKFGGGLVSPPYRFIPALAPDGLDLSSYAPDIGEFERMVAGHFDEPIEAIQIVADPPAQAYESEVRVRYFEEAPV